MNFKACVTLGLLAAILVIPQSVLSQNSSETTEASTDDGSTTTANPNACTGQDGGLVALLTQLGNLLGNLLDNVPLLGRAGLTNPGGLLDLAGVLVQVQKLLNGLLDGLQLGNLNLTQSDGLISRLLDQLTTTLNDLLGGSQGDKWRCQNSGGSTGGLIGRLINGVGTGVTGSDATHNLGLLTLVNGLLWVVGQLLKVLGVGGLVGGLLPGLGVGPL